MEICRDYMLKYKSLALQAIIRPVFEADDLYMEQIYNRIPENPNFKLYVELYERLKGYKTWYGRDQMKKLRLVALDDKVALILKYHQGEVEFRGVHERGVSSLMAEMKYSIAHGRGNCKGTCLGSIYASRITLVYLGLIQGGGNFVHKSSEYTSDLILHDTMCFLYSIGRLDHTKNYQKNDLTQMQTVEEPSHFISPEEILQNLYNITTEEVERIRQDIAKLCQYFQMQKGIFIDPAYSLISSELCHLLSNHNIDELFITSNR